MPNKDDDIGKPQAKSRVPFWKYQVCIIQIPSRKEQFLSIPPYGMV